MYTGHLIVARHDFNDRSIPVEADNIRLKDNRRDYHIKASAVAIEIDDHRKLKRTNQGRPVANFGSQDVSLDEIDESAVDRFCGYLLQHVLDLLSSCGTEDTIERVVDEYCNEVDPSNHFNYQVPRPGPRSYREDVRGWVRNEVLIRQFFFLYPSYKSLVPYHP